VGALYTRSIEGLKKCLRVTFEVTQETQVVNLYINERRERDVAVLDLRGRMRISGGTLALHRSIRCLVDEGKTKILLNLAGVTHIDSSGLGELISSYVTLSNKGGQIKLVHLTDRLQDIMTITKIVTVFDVYDNEADALASFTDHVLSIVEPQSVCM
jgi:anti-anti-sigma factor